MDAMVDVERLCAHVQTTDRHPCSPFLAPRSSRANDKRLVNLKKMCGRWPSTNDSIMLSFIMLQNIANLSLCCSLCCRAFPC
jgi:hypothetical protein